ncbi:hypothetical protein [Paraburkholderia sp. BR13444]|uniref:hypothetical protein n=1 Tax=Paraburkholderia sp. BR13444 TaxID=3236997 RepID=UPI0034CF6009
MIDLEKARAGLAAKWAEYLALFDRDGSAEVEREEHRAEADLLRLAIQVFAGTTPPLPEAPTPEQIAAHVLVLHFLREPRTKAERVRWEKHSPYLFGEKHDAASPRRQRNLDLLREVAYDVAARPGKRFVAQAIRELCERYPDVDPVSFRSNVYDHDSYREARDFYLADYRHQFGAPDEEP